MGDSIGELLETGCWGNGISELVFLPDLRVGILRDLLAITEQANSF
jgi:hypothetical protein